MLCMYNGSYFRIYMGSRQFKDSESHNFEKNPRMLEYTKDDTLNYVVLRVK